MRSHYEKCKGPDAQGVPVALQVFSEKNLNSGEFALTWGQQTDPREVPANSEFLGFDVADPSGISGLSNCEYSSNEQELLRPIWVPRINRFGLLDTLEHAIEFRGISDRRMSGHSPFWVCGISRLPSTD
jgi:hypothetical protein